MGGGENVAYLVSVKAQSKGDGIREMPLTGRGVGAKRVGVRLGRTLNKLLTSVTLLKIVLKVISGELAFKVEGRGLERWSSMSIPQNMSVNQLLAGVSLLEIMLQVVCCELLLQLESCSLK